MQGKIKYIIVTFAALVVIGAFLLLFMSDKEVKEDKTETGAIVKDTGKTVPAGASDERIEKVKPEHPALNEEEKERRANLASALQKRWEKDKELLLKSCKKVGLTEEQTQYVIKSIDERNEEFLDLSTRRAENNLEFEKARRRLYNKYKKKLIDYLGRRLHQKLVENAPSIFAIN